MTTDTERLIAEAEAALEGVTAGDWEFIPAGNRPDVCQKGNWVDGYICAVESQNFAADARFIAWARNNVPALIAALRAMQAERDARIEPEIVDSMLDDAQPIMAEALASETERADDAEAKLAQVEKEYQDFMTESKSREDAFAMKIGTAEAKVKEMALDVLAASGQAQEAYEAQLAAEAKLAEVQKERDEAQAALDSIETNHGLTSNGNLWRFWAKQAREIADKNADMRATVASLKEQVDAMRGAIGILEDALQEAGDDYPGSRMQEWCQQQVSLARAALTTEKNDG